MRSLRRGLRRRLAGDRVAGGWHSGRDVGVT